MLGVKEILKRRGRAKDAIFLHTLAKSIDKQNTIPEVGATVMGDDFGIPPDASAQNIPFQTIRRAYPTLSLEDALKLEGEYIFPTRAVAGDMPIEYLKGHEGSHREDNLANFRLMNPEGGNFISNGIGNKGYLPTKHNDPTNPSSVEGWLQNYAPIERPQERKAHRVGMIELLLHRLKSK